MARSVVIVGGGISGLSLAFFLRSRGITPLLLESRDRVGGSIWSESRDAFLLERGPNTTGLSNMALYDLICGAGLESHLQFPPPTAKKRFILKNGTLHALPMGPGSLLSTPVFSFGGKLRVVREPWIAKSTDRSETVAHFFTRRFGEQITEYAVKPFISGIYAGDADTLAMRAAFPGVWEAEQEYGSVIGGFIKRSRAQRKAGTKKPKPPNSGKSFTFPAGLQELSDTLHTMMRDDIITSAENISFVPAGAGQRVSWTVGATSYHEDAERVVLSVPAYAAGGLVRPHDAALATALESIVYAPVAIVHLGFKKTDIAHPLDGFGFLVPPCENREVLGCIFSSSLFPSRAPEGHHLLTCFMVGARRRDLLDRDDAGLIATALGELSGMIGITGDPMLTMVTRIPRAIPQYTVPYTAVIDAVESFEKRTENVFFCNNFKGGISIGDCVESAGALAEQLAPAQTA